MRRSILHGAVIGWMTLATIGATMPVPGGAALAAPPPTMSDRDDMQPPTAERAQALQGEGKWAEAAEAWHALVEHEPDNGTAWFNLGYCLHAAGRLEEAIEAHEKAATFDDYHGIALYNLGCAHALAGRPGAAFEALSRSQATGFRMRGQVEDDSDLDSLRDDPRYEALLDREPAGAAGMLQQMMTGVRQFVQQRAPQVERQIAGMLRQTSRQLRGMIGQLQRKLASDERFAMIARQIQQWMGGSSGAGPRSPEAGTGPLAEAPEAEMSPAPDVRATLDMARRHQQAGEWEAAAAAYAAVVAAEPKNAPAAFGHALCLHMSGDYERAIEAHKSAARFEELRGVALYNLACAYALTGKTDKALRALVDARAAGFDVADQARSDPDLKSLHDDPRFMGILAGKRLGDA